MITTAIAIAALTAAAAVGSNVGTARKHKKLSGSLLFERRELVRRLDKIEDELTKKVARLSPKQQVNQAANRLRNLRLWARV